MLILNDQPRKASTSMLFKSVSLALAVTWLIFVTVFSEELRMYAGTKKRLWFGPKISDYHQVDCPDHALGLYIFGQSNSSNTVRPMKKHDVSDRVFQFDWRTGKCFKYQEPLLGTMDFYSHPITPLMANFDKIYDREVIVVPFGVPGSSIIDWSFGSLRLMTKSVFIKLQN